MRRTDRKRPATGSLQAIFAVGFGQIQQPKAGSVALLRMRPVLKLPLHDGARTDADVLPPVQEPPRCPFHVFAMGARHVLR
jgi:hypothetical protein